MFVFVIVSVTLTVAIDVVTRIAIVVAVVAVVAVDCFSRHDQQYTTVVNACSAETSPFVSFLYCDLACACLLLVNGDLDLYYGENSFLALWWRLIPMSSLSTIDDVL